MGFRSKKEDKDAQIEDLEELLDEQDVADEEASDDAKKQEFMDLQIDKDDYCDEGKASYKNKGGHKHASKTTGLATRDGVSKSKVPAMLKVVRIGAAVYGSYTKGMYEHIKKSEEACKEAHRQKASALASMREMVGSRATSFSECFEKAMHEAKMAEIEKKKEKYTKRKEKVEAAGERIAAIGSQASSIADMGAKRETNTLLAGRVDGTTAEIPTTEGAVTAANRARQAENIMNGASGKEGAQYE